MPLTRVNSVSPQDPSVTRFHMTCTRRIITETSQVGTKGSSSRGEMRLLSSDLRGKLGEKNVGAGWQINADETGSHQKSVAWLLKEYSFENYPAESTVQPNNHSAPSKGPGLKMISQSPWSAGQRVVMYIT